MIKNYLVNKCDEYTIDFRPQSDGTIKMFATEHPSDPWSKGAHENHLYPSGALCVSAGQEPRSMERAAAIAMVWCEGWSEYCRTGVFPKTAKRVNV